MLKVIPAKQKAKIRQIFQIKTYFCNLALTLKNIANLGYLFSKSKYLINSLPNFIANISIKVIAIPLQIEISNMQPT